MLVRGKAFDLDSREAIYKELGDTADAVRSGSPLLILCCLVVVHDRCSFTAKLHLREQSVKVFSQLCVPSNGYLRLLCKWR